MKCIFKDTLCVRVGGGHDDCRRCRNVPDMTMVFNESVMEHRYLCAIAGKREKEVKYHGSISGKKPAWLTALVKKDKGMRDCIPCTDHRRYLDPMVINEPYRVHMEEIRSLIKFCDENGLSFSIDGQSAHFPGRCFRILITKPKKASVLKGNIGGISNE